MSNDSSNSALSRRSILKIGGAALVGVWSGHGTPALAGQQPAASPSGKPLYLAPENADIAVYSRAENLFWCDIMMEHAALFAMLMPGTELAAQRNQAEAFQKSFQTQYDRAKAGPLDKTNYVSFNRSTVEMIKPFADYKRRMLDAQTSGKMRSFVFPLMFEHTAGEADHAIRRLEKLSTGDTNLDYAEIVDFWSSSTSGESELISHFLDPQEQELISQALDSSAMFKGFNQANKDHSLKNGDIVLALEDFIEFESTLEDGVDAGRIKSIMNPVLADHMRREALKFMDEVRRTGRKT